MSQHPNASQSVNTFIHLLRELESFADVSSLKIAFDGKGNVFLIGADFQAQLRSNLTLHREVRAELLQQQPRALPEG